MKPCVLDASAIAAVFFQDPGAEKVRALLSSGRPMHAPDLVHAEVANVIWKRCGRGEIDHEEAGDMLGDCLRLGLEITPCDELVELALQLALAAGRTVYDCFYLAMAISIEGKLFTADKKLVNALAGTPLEKHVELISGAEAPPQKG